MMYFIISMIASFGIAVALVEKGRDWPIRRFKLRLKRILKDIDPRLPRMLNCAPCTSFWASLFVDLVLLVVAGHFLWPISGFIAFGFTWIVFEFLNAIEKRTIVFYNENNKTDKQ